MTLTFAPAGSDALPLHVLEPAGLEAWLEDQPEATRAWVAANGFQADLGSALMIPGPAGRRSVTLIPTRVAECSFAESNQPQAQILRGFKYELDRSQIVLTICQVFPRNLQ